MPNINKNIIMQAGAAVANATNKAAGLSTATPEPGSIISVIQLVNGGRTIGPDALAHFTESVRNNLLSLLVSMEHIQSGSGTPSPDNVRPISGRTGLNVYVSPTSNIADATTYTSDWTSQAGTVYGGTLDVVTGVLTVDWAYKEFDGTEEWFVGVNFIGLFNAVEYESKDNNDRTQISNIFIGEGIYYAKYNAFRVQTNKAVLVGNQNEDGTVGRWADATAFKSFLASLYSAGTPFAVCYKLATPITYQLTAQDIITLVGDNYIWSDSGDVTITE